MHIDTLVKTYLDEHIQLSKDFPIDGVVNLTKALIATYKKGGSVFIFGNGGGASIADHFASDLRVHPFLSEDKSKAKDITRLKVYCLNDSSGMITRIANDIGYEDIFSEQLVNYSISSKDLVIALSTSGNSPNILKALAYSIQRGAVTACIGKGGRAMGMVNIGIFIVGNSTFPGQVGANNNTFNTEDFQTMIGHMLTGLLMEEVNG